MKHPKKPSSSPLELALRFLSFRPRSGAEVASYLKRKHVTPADLTSTIAKLKDNQFIDDTKFAQWYQANRDNNHPIGARLLQFELRQKGISSEIITQVIDNSTATQLHRAHKALQKKNLKNPSQFLARRGFSWDIISRVTSSSYDWPILTNAVQ